MGFAASLKPRAVFRVAKPGRLEVLVSFALSGLSPSCAADTAEWQRSDAATSEDTPPAPPGQPPVPAAYGHRFATQLQLRHRLAGDQYVGTSHQLEAFPLDPAAL